MWATVAYKNAVMLSPVQGGFQPLLTPAGLDTPTLGEFEVLQPQISAFQPVLCLLTKTF